MVVQSIYIQLRCQKQKPPRGLEVDQVIAILNNIAQETF